MKNYQELLNEIKNKPKSWLITGVAGFIGSNLLETLLKNNQKVIGIDNFSTGFQSNLDEVRGNLTNDEWNNFNFIKNDICNYDICYESCTNVDYVLHQAALGSVPRSIKNPLDTNKANVTGFLNIINAAKENNVKSFTYASSSSAYGDHEALPKIEENIGKPLSPYAGSKLINEIYAEIFSKTYGFNSIGLRYFNVFGKRQNPDGPYAAVIPKWIMAIIKNDDVNIYGDGETSRDFCFVENAVQANILAAISSSDAKNNIYNVALGDRTSLNQLFQFIKVAFDEHDIDYAKKPIYSDFRKGDVRHSKADISKAVEKLNYSPTHKIKDGIIDTISWYLSKFKT